MHHVRNYPEEFPVDSIMFKMADLHSGTVWNTVMTLRAIMLSI